MLLYDSVVGDTELHLQPHDCETSCPAKYCSCMKHRYKKVSGKYQCCLTSLIRFCLHIICKFAYFSKEKSRRILEVVDWLIVGVDGQDASTVQCFGSIFNWIRIQPKISIRILAIFLHYLKIIHIYFIIIQLYHQKRSFERYIVVKGKIIKKNVDLFLSPWIRIRRIRIWI